jgi:hypothetical protein
MDSLKNLFANLLRISAGAGEPSAVHNQLRACCEEFDAFRERGEQRPVDLVYRKPGGYDAFQFAEGAMIDGAMRYVAAQMAGSSTQATHGRNRMIQGATDWIKARDEDNRRR